MAITSTPRMNPGPVGSDDLRRKLNNVMPGRAFGFSAQQHVGLLQGDGNSNASQHRVHDDRRDRQRGSSHTAEPQCDLQDTRGNGDETRHRPTEIRDQIGNDDRQAGCRAAYLQR